MQINMLKPAVRGGTGGIKVFKRAQLLYSSQPWGPPDDA